MGFLSGGMNSWFCHEFMVFSMGSISANIMNYMEKLITAMSVMVLAESDGGALVSIVVPIDDRAYRTI
jgi:hypothetical protein